LSIIGKGEGKSVKSVRADPFHGGIVKLILVRHGETIWNRDNRVQGLSDIALTERGRKQVEHLARSLRNEKIDVILSSPLSRARETARTINRYHGVAIELDDDLRELDVGDLDGLTFEEMRTRYREFLKQWTADPTSVTMPNGETLHELQVRAWRAIERIISGSKNAVVVSHNFTIMAIMCKMRDMHLSKMRKTGVEVASKTCVEIDGTTKKIIVFNDISHLDDETYGGGNWR